MRVAPPERQGGSGRRRKAGGPVPFANDEQGVPAPARDPEDPNDGNDGNEN
ncbi:hypothetical protein [Cupriavidus lacunae]|uniref:hypothetical protein n=1 Tax=Cupriavidus lacunae TaxID=2666307 RepID=UPI003CC69CA4